MEFGVISRTERHKMIRVDAFLHFAQVMELESGSNFTIGSLVENAMRREIFPIDVHRRIATPLTGKLPYPTWRGIAAIFFNPLDAGLSVLMSGYESNRVTNQRARLTVGSSCNGYFLSAPALTETGRIRRGNWMSKATTRKAWPRAVSRRVHHMFSADNILASARLTEFDTIRLHWNGLLTRDDEGALCRGRWQPLPGFLAPKLYQIGMRSTA